jgi:hypothetical protein
VPARRILVIDDRPDELRQLVDAINVRLGDEAVVDWWQPVSRDDLHPLDELERNVSAETALIVTDFDLTSSMRGFFGSSVVAWANSKYYPVCNFSRGTPGRLPQVADLFEFRLDPVPDATADEVARIYRGFSKLHEALSELEQEGGMTSPAEALGIVLKRPESESEFAPYFSRVGAANGAIVGTLQKAAHSPKGGGAVGVGQFRLLEYVVGHVLCNAILRYPGPLLDEDVLCAYVGHSSDAASQIRSLFANARYAGPFAGNRDIFWRSDVDGVLDRLARPENWDEFETVDVQNRKLVAHALSSEFEPHGCDRCGGDRGGFWCPFSLRAVCERSDCSVSSSSWVPDGAWVARVEKDFYDEWAPMLGY